MPSTFWLVAHLQEKNSLFVWLFLVLQRDGSEDSGLNVIARVLFQWRQYGVLIVRQE